MARDRRILVFTDLDGTLLDHFDYSWEEARPALNALFEHGIPLVFCSSKTRKESIYFRGLMGVEDPFVVENGAAIYVPMGYFPRPVSEKQRNGYEVIEYGVPYSVLRQFLQEVRESLGINVVGFGDLDAERIRELTALPRHLAEFAWQREYNEPFFFPNREDESRIDEIIALARKKNLTITRGGRFYHVSGPHDKGKAVRRLIELYKAQIPARWTTVAVGDSLNDLPMLEQVDYPCVVKNHRGEYSEEILQRLKPRLAPGSGPVGWAAVILDLLQELT